jgi:APA family basic amino acid/polyamine antiporter
MKKEAIGSLQRFVPRRTATLLVVANIIGAGIFTTTGFQAADIGHPLVILGLWLLGGVIALSGALAYGELGAAMPSAGGEYVYLRRTYGGAFGFMSAFVSLVAGFSAPIASVVKGLVGYLAPFAPALAEGAGTGPVNLGDVVAIGIVWLLIVIQLRGAKVGFHMVDWVTLTKVGGIVAILVAAVLVGRGRLAGLVTPGPNFAELGPAGVMTGVATSLIFVMFCYSGWNAAAYIAGELRDPERDLPRSLLLGTGIVVLLYLGMNAVYFYGASMGELAGRVEVGQIAAHNLFGEVGAVLVTVVLCASLLGSATAMTVAGPRVYYALGRDYRAFRFLARTGSGRGVPVTALLLQGVVTSAIILSGRIDQIMQYAGFTLTLFASLAVSCVITLRIRRPDMPRPFRCWGYPWTPLFFLAVSGWMMAWAVRGRPMESLLSLITVGVGGLIFLLLGPRADEAPEEPQ